MYWGDVGCGWKMDYGSGWAGLIAWIRAVKVICYVWFPGFLYLTWAA